MVAQYTRVSASGHSTPARYTLNDLVYYPSGTSIATYASKVFSDCPLACQVVSTCVGYTIDLGAGIGLFYFFSLHI